MSIHSDVPFLDLVTPHLELERELMEVFRTTLHTAGWIGGPMVEEFEKAFAEFCDTKCAVGVSSGTDALRFALIGCGVQPGDVVVTVPNTFIATTEAITQAGALPEFVDVDKLTYNMDSHKLREYLEQNCSKNSSGRLISLRSNRPVTAVIPVHLYGQIADMDAILDLAESFHLIVIEDACQAHGAEYFSRMRSRWLKAGSTSRAAAFSFYPGKNLGACGDAGAVTTNDEAIAAKVRMLRDHGQSKKYHHDLEGYNGRLDSIQAGFLRVKLRHLLKGNEQRRQRAADYGRLLTEADCGVSPPYEPEWSKAVHHLYVVRSNDRNGLMDYLKNSGIGTGIHYPIPLHLQNAYRSLGYRRGDFPVTEQFAAEILSLPMYPSLARAEQERVVSSILRYITAEDLAEKSTKFETDSYVSA